MSIARRVVAVLLLITSSIAEVSAQEPNSEYKLKAAFLYNFAKFVEWPGGTRALVVICIVGKDPFGSILEDTMGGHAINGRRIAIRRLGVKDRTEQCEVVFIGSPEKNKVPEILAGVPAAQVLTVGDTPGFAAAGGMIGFVVDKDKLRFEINAGCAQRAGLTISSRLLHLASFVIGGPGQDR